jgi:glucan biosynthesis protein
MEKIKTMEEAMLNPELTEVVQVDNALKDFIVEYTGEELNPENGEVTVEMVIEVLASHFPEVVFALAEENFIRGYQQAMTDLEVSEEEEQNTPYDHLTQEDVERMKTNNE